MKYKINKNSCCKNVQKYLQLQIRMVDMTGECERNRKTNTAFEEKHVNPQRNYKFPEEKKVVY